jgi:hypothetical protein
LGKKSARAWLRKETNSCVTVRENYNSYVNARQTCSIKAESLREETT